MDKRLKKIIAREGLILLSILALGLLIIIIGNILAERYSVQLERGIEIIIPDEYILANNLKRIGIIISLFVFPIYLLIRFILWTIKILRLK